LENKMDTLQTIKQYKSKIDSRLREFLKLKVERFEHISPLAKELMENILEFNLRGGKRIRPILTYFGYMACGGEDEEAILQACLAVELMESFLLIHDDIMDQDELRRGYLTMHKIFEKKCERNYARNGKHYGESMAIIAGDILAVLGSETILSSRFPLKNKMQAIETFNRAVINTCIGQALDVSSQVDDTLQEEDICRMYELKTSIYTFQAPLHIGAQLAGAGKYELKLLSDYALPLGRAFQIQDDILGLYSTRQKIGKPVGSDIREGKKTLLILKAQSLAGTQDKLFIKKCLGNPKITDDDIKKVKKILNNSGALAYCKEETKKQATIAKHAIINAKL